MIKTGFKIDSALKVGLTTLHVKDLASMVEFYQNEIGLNALEGSDDDGMAVTLGIGADNRPIVRLVSKPNGRAYPKATGLFHLAILLPTRADLGQSIATTKT